MRPSARRHHAVGPVPDQARSLLPDAGGGAATSALDPPQVADELVATLVGRWADHVAVHLRDDPPLDARYTGDGRPERRAAADPVQSSHAAHAGHAALRRYAVGHAPGPSRPDTISSTGSVLRPPAQSPVLISLAKGETVHLPHADSMTADHLAAQLGDARLAASLRNCSILLVPLIADDSLLGNVMLVREPGRPAFGDDAIATAEAVARWATRCMDGGLAYRRTAALAAELRREFLPVPPPRLAGIELCYRYLPESRTARIGGDWFDVIPLADGRVGLVMGDVMGHGVEAATVMRRCRTIVCTLAMIGLSADEVLRRFDELACLHDEDHVATCLAAIYDPASRQCQVANAGQIPPILIDPGGRGEVIDVPTGSPAGVGRADFEARSFPIAPGSVLALCTDGLTALYDVDVDRALERLCGSLSGPARSFDELCDDTLTGVNVETRKDDVTLLLARFPDDPVP